LKTRNLDIMAKTKQSVILSDEEKNKLDDIKRKIKENIKQASPANILQVACDNFKFAFEEAIKIAGEKGKQSLTTSSQHINLFHEVVKSELIQNGISSSLIFPPQYSSQGELNLAGFIKAKKQDISVVSNQFSLNKIPEQITSGMMHGQIDPNGKDYTENTLVINVRSQMSSIGKNDDTIFERAFAETLNLHMRCRNMVLGELFILPIKGFDMTQVKKKNPVFEQIIITKKKANSKTTAEATEECINTYSALNKRDLTKDESYKYERVCLILADFSTNPVKIYKNDADLKADNLLPIDSTATLNGLEFDTFISDLLEIYQTRFPTNTFI
jgi:hypothetical protein